MTTVSKAGVVLSAAVGVAFLALAGCASQQSGAATPANLPSNCKAVASCKGQASCKGVSNCKAVHSCKGKKVSHHKVMKKSTTTTSTTTAQ